MAIRVLSLSRSVFTGKQALASFLSRSYSVSSSSLSVSHFSPTRLRSLASVALIFNGATPASLGGFRAFSTRQTQSSLNDSSPNWSNRPPKETILLDGCDFEHWLVVVEKPDENLTRDDIIDMYIKTLAQVVGSEEEARMKIYSVSTRYYFAFGALVSEELSYKLKELPKVRWVLPDSYLDVKNKDYGGEPFINGQAVPYDPKYHEEWVRNNAKAMERNRRQDRPRNFDRSRNFERRRENMQGQGPPPMHNQGPPPMQNQGPPPMHNQGPPPMHNQGPPPMHNQGPPPMHNQGPPMHNQGPPPMHNQGPPPTYNQGPPQGPPMGGPPPLAGALYNNNMGGPPPPHMRGPPPPPHMGGPPNGGWQGNQQNFQGGGYPQNPQGPAPGYHGGYAPNNSTGGQPSGGSQYPGEDMPMPPRSYQR